MKEEKIKRKESLEPMADISNTTNIETRKNETKIKYKFRAVMFDDEDSFGIIEAILNSSKKS